MNNLSVFSNGQLEVQFAQALKAGDRMVAFEIAVELNKREEKNILTLADFRGVHTEEEEEGFFQWYVDKFGWKDIEDPPNPNDDVYLFDEILVAA